MNICGVELTGSDLVVCLLNKTGQLFDLPECRVKKMTLPKDHTAKDLQYFQFTFAKLMEDYKVERVVIKERQTKGKFAGGAISFKLEAAVQLIEAIDVKIISAVQCKTILSENPVPIEFAETGLKAFQEQAFKVAYASHME